MPLGKRAAAEFIGTFWLVLAGCGTVLFTSNFALGGTGILGVALAFGFAVVSMGYALGPISGAHLNPAVSLGLAMADRFPMKELPAYAGAQVVGGGVATGVLYVVAAGKKGFELRGFATNGFEDFSPGNFSMAACLVAEVVLTFVLVFAVLGATDGKARQALAPLAIGLTYAAIHLVGMPITNMGGNPARSTGPALVVGGFALKQLWAFWLAPLSGAALAGLVYPAISGAASGGKPKPSTKRGAPMAEAAAGGEEPEAAAAPSSTEAR